VNKAKILLDMDGVLVDFIGRFLELQFPFDCGHVKDEFLSGKSFPPNYAAAGASGFSPGEEPPLPPFKLTFPSLCAILYT